VICGLTAPQFDSTEPDRQAGTLMASQARINESYRAADSG
jgi:hypothetical protein